MKITKVLLALLLAASVGLASVKDSNQSQGTTMTLNQVESIA